MQQLVTALLFALMLTDSAWAQTATDLHEGTRLTYDPVNQIGSFAWWGRAGRTYFIQQSPNLIEWHYAPVIRSGQDDVIQWSFPGNADQWFLRLTYTDIATSDPLGDDFDGDGIANMDELTAPSELNLDPFDLDSNDNGIVDGLEDMDADTLPDWWEIYWFGNLDQSADQDTDNDFIYNGSEFLAGTNPTIGQERFLVLERWPSNSPADADGVLNPSVELQLLGSLGFPLSNAHLQLSIESGPFEFVDVSAAPTQTITQSTDSSGRIATRVRLNDFYIGKGSIRVTAGLDDHAPSLVLPISVAPGLPPASPVSVAAVATTVNTATISWQATQDAIAEQIHYEIYRDGAALGISTDLQFTDSLPDGWQTAVYEVAAVDRTGARSTSSLPAILRALPAIGVAPPTGMYLVEEKGVRATVAWKAAASDFGIAAYHVELNEQIVATSPDTRWTFTNLSPETAYKVVVYAVDQRGQVSAASDVLQFSTSIAPVRQVRAGGSQTHWFEPGQTLHAWGDNRLDTLGAHYPEDSISREAVQTVPISAALHPQVADVACGSFSSIVKSTEGSVTQVGVFKLEPSQETQSFYRSPALEQIDIEAIGAGSYHFMAIAADTGSVYAWGVNAYRQLGYSTGDAYESIIPQAVVTADGALLTGAIEVAGGDDFSLARMADGTLRSWGRKTRLGRLDHSGNSNQWDFPRPVLTASAQALDGIVAIAAGARHSLALDSNGQVWSFGNNASLQLGRIQDLSESNEAFLGDHLVPQRVHIDANNQPILENIVQIAAGVSHSIALDDQGDVWCWGSSEYGQLGLPDHLPVFMQLAQHVPALADIQIVAIAAGDYSSYACAADGTIWAWGRNQLGQLGDGTTENRSTPVSVLVGAEHITFTPYRSAPNADSGVFLSTARIGTDIRYTLDGNTVTETSPLATAGIALSPAPGTVVQARPYLGNLPIGEAHRWRMPTVLSGAAGNGVAAHIDVAGQLSVWGKSIDYMPGRSTGVRHALGELAGVSVRRIDISADSLQALTGAGELFAWGDNAEGQLLFGGASRLILPVREPQLAGAAITASALSADNESGYGGAHRIIRSDQWITTGVNTKGQLGLIGSASNTRAFGPLEIAPTQHPIEQISAGTGVSFLHDTLGNTWVFGDHRLSGYSRLGYANYLANGVAAFDRVAVSNLTQIRSGTVEVAGLRSDGTVWFWGLDIDKDAFELPTQVYAEFAPGDVEPLAEIIEIAHGYRHGLALRADGTVWTWGDSLEGALGYATRYPNDTLARQVPGLEHIHWIAAGNESSFAGSADGTIWGWGRNAYGELGDPTLPGGTTPVMLSIPAITVPEPPADDPDPPLVDETGYWPPSLTDLDAEPLLGPHILIEVPSDLTTVQ